MMDSKDIKEFLKANSFKEKKATDKRAAMLSRLLTDLENKRKKTFKSALHITFLSFLLLFVASLVFQAYWNYVLAPHFGIGTIGYSHSLGMYIVFGYLFDRRFTFEKYTNLKEVIRYKVTRLSVLSITWFILFFFFRG